MCPATASMERDAYLEALLFYRGEPVEVKERAKVLECTAKDIEESLITLKKRLEGSGIALLRVNTSVELASAPGAAKLIERIRKEELSKDLGKAGSETLAIILYRSPVTRAEIDYLRGVNSTFIFRNLMIRGLIERVPNPSDQRSFCYR